MIEDIIATEIVDAVEMTMIAGEAVKTIIMAVLVIMLTVIVMDCRYSTVHE